jgi:hypothetical protein
MFLAAALVPDTALLVPGVGGVADAGAEFREPALAAVGEAAASGGRIVVVAPGRADRRRGAMVQASLGAAGVPDEALGWRTPAQVRDWPAPSAPDRSGPAAGVSASVALFLLAQHHAAAAEVVEVAAHDEAAGRATALHALGARLVADGPTSLVVVGSPSGRHGPDAPLPDDPRAPAYDDALLADLADAGPDARERLARLDPAPAAALAVTGWAPWQVLLGAVGDTPVEARLLARHVLAGATHAVLTWRGPAPEASS